MGKKEDTEIDIHDKINEFCTSILNILVDRSNIIFYDQLDAKKPQLLQKVLNQFSSYFLLRYKLR